MHNLFSNTTILKNLSIIDSVTSNFDSRNLSVGIAVERNESSIVRISLPFKDLVSTYAVQSGHLRDASKKIGPTLQPVFVSKKLEQDLIPKEAKPSIVKQQCVVYHFV